MDGLERVPPEAALTRLVRIAVRAVQECEACGVSVVAAEGVVGQGTSDERARRLDRHQHDHAEGPAVLAIRSGEPVLMGAGDTRWPAFTEEVRSEGFVAVYAVPFGSPSPGGWTGALTFYGTRPFTDDALELADLFATQAEVALANARSAEEAHSTVEQLRSALASRDLIGQAKGVLMARRGIDQEEAFDLLRCQSQRLNRKLRDVAAATVAERDLPGDVPL